MFESSSKIQLTKDLIINQYSGEVKQNFLQKSIIMTSTNPNKPFTGNFQLETKIRVIIQQVLAATIRKLSVFNQKIDKFQDYFIVYKQKVQSLEKNTAQNKSAINVEYDERLKIRKQFANQMIKSEEVQQKNLITFDETQNQVKEMTKTIKQIQRQNQNLNNQLSKTKGKFLEYSNVISSLKQEVSWKITKYIEQTAQTNTAIKINHQQVKKEYFNVMLMLQKQKQKYDKIIEMSQNTENNTKRIHQNIQRLDELNKARYDDNRKTVQKIDQYDTILQSKLKTLDNKCELRISELQKDNKKMMHAVKKLQTFNEELQEIKAQQQKNRLQIVKKLQDTNKRAKQESQVQIVKLSKQVLKVQKTLDKKLTELKESTQKAQDFLTQKIQFMKMQIQTEISSHTNKLIEQKQNSTKVNSSTMDQISAKMNKFNMDVHKQVAKVQNSVKQVRSEMKKQMQTLKENVDNKLESIESLPRKMSQQNSPGGKKISPQLLKQIEDFSSRINTAFQSLQVHSQQIAQLKQGQSRSQIFQKQMIKKIDTYFKDQQEQISGKVQKIMFLITKMRGDGIIRNQFTQKEIKQIKRNHLEYKNYTESILKLVPAFGQCINLILALIYDAEFQHSKIIQDTLPLLKKDQEQFNTCLEGVLYEFKQKKKAGVICYRHKDIKKTEIVKATFNAYIKVWEELFENEFKNKNQFLPKGFYKKAVENTVTIKGGQSKGQKKQSSLSPNKQSSFYENLASSVGFTRPLEPINNTGGFQSRRKTAERQEGSSSQTVNFGNGLNHMASKQAAKSLKKIQQEEMIRQIKDSRQSLGKQGLQNGSNSSFHIRKKKLMKKEEVIVMNVTNLGQ